MILDLNEVVYKFINSLNILYNKNCPLLITKKIHKNHKINPWMTDSLIKCLSKKKLYKQFVRNNLHENK